jgi:sodium-dependent dicarboxylate transporter 2/3/5
MSTGNAARTSNTRRLPVEHIGLVAGPVLAGICWLVLPAEYLMPDGRWETFDPAGRTTLALMVWMATWWLTEAVEISVTALLPLAVLPLGGGMTIKAVAAPYASDLIFLFMGGFMLALSMQRWSLDRRIALVTLRLVGTRPANMIGGCMMATAMISGFVSNTATAAMMLPIGLGVVELVRSRTASAESSHSQNFATCMILGIAYAGSIGGVATIIGSPPNTFLVGFLRDQIDPDYRATISFVKWMAIGVPLVAVFLPISWWLLTRVLYPVRDVQITGGRELLAETYARLGPIQRGELATLIVFGLAATAWIIRPILSEGLHAAGDPDQLFVPPLVPGLSDAGIAITAALALFLIPVDWRRRQFVMNWETASKLPWGILILFGGGLSLAAAIEGNGVAEFIGSQTHRLAHVPPVVLVIVVVASVVFFSELASNTATVTTLAPILAAIAPGLGVHPYLLVVPACLAASCAFMLPVGTPPNAIAFGTGLVTVRQMMRAGLCLNIIGIVLVTLLTLAIVRPLLL